MYVCIYIYIYILALPRRDDLGKFVVDDVPLGVDDLSRGAGGGSDD